MEGELAAGRLSGPLADVAAGDAQALARLYEELRRPVFLLALSVLRDYAAAEDVMQDTFVRVREHAAECRSVRGRRAWVLAVAHSIALTRCKRMAREQPAEELPERPVPEGAESAAELSQALAQLDEPDRSVVALHVFGGLRHAETAAVLGLSTGAARVRYHRALARLRRYYEQADKE